MSRTLAGASSDGRNDLDCTTTMMAPPFEKDFHSDRNQFRAKFQQDMRSECDDDLDGLRNIGSVANEAQRGSEEEAEKEEEVGSGARLRPVFGLSLSLDNNQQDSSLNRSNPISNEQANGQLEQRGEFEFAGSGQQAVRAQNSSSLLSDNRHETRSRRRFYSLTSSSADNKTGITASTTSTTATRRKEERSKVLKQVSEAGQEWWKRKEEQLDELSPLQVNKQSGRERSSSTTSDYFSSSHDSPIINHVSLSAANKQQIGGKKCVLSLLKEEPKVKESQLNIRCSQALASTQQQQREESTTATIYENPAFVQDQTVDFNQQQKQPLEEKIIHLNTRSKRKSKWDKREEEKEFKMEGSERTSLRRDKQNCRNSGSRNNEEMLKSLR